MRRRPAALLIATTLAAGVTGCAALGVGAGPTPCDQLFSARRCLMMTVFAATQAGASRQDVVAIDVMPEPTSDTPPGVLMVRSGGPDVHARITLRDGSMAVVSMGCRGIPNRMTCLDDQPLEIGGGQMNHDLPCAGEPPDGCATPIPSLQADAVANATALRIDRLDIPIDHVGDYHVVLGEVLLPNGIITEESASFVNDRPPGVVILSGGVGVAVRSLEPDGRPFGNIYDHGWRPGTERVEAYLGFHVDAFDPAATLSIADIVVR